MKRASPPAWARLLAQLLLRGDDAEYLLGDLHEDYDGVLDRRGRRAANAWYRRQVMASAAAQLGRPDGAATWLRDLRMALRRVRLAPAYALVTTGTLALGIAGAAVVASLAATVLRPLPLPASDALVAVWETRQGRQRAVSPANYLDWRRLNRTFAGLAAHDVRSQSVTVDGVATRERVALVSGNFFDVLGVPAAVGRAFTPDLDVAFPEREIVLSSSGASRLFGGAHLALGRQLQVDDLSYAVVGVAPPELAFPEAGVAGWTRSPTEAPEIRGLPVPVTELRDAWYFEVVGRLRPDATLETARDDMNGVADQLAGEYPETNETSGVLLVPLLDQTIAGFGAVLTTLALAVLLVLLAALLNASHLTRARAVAGRADTAIRISLGASRARLARASLVEGWLLGASGAVLGLLSARPVLAIGRAHLSEVVPRAHEVRLDPTMVLAGVGLGIAAGTLLAMVQHAHAAGSAPVRGRLARSTPGRALIAAQVAVSIAVLSGAGILLQSFSGLGRVELGFDTDGLETLRLSIPDAPALPYETRIDEYRRVTDALARLPGVASVGFGANGPLEVGPSAGVFREGVEWDGDPPDVGWQPVDTGYFGALGMTRLRGRAFAPSDGPSAVHVAIVNEAFVREVFGAEDPLGGRVTIGLDGHDRPLTIVGVVADTRTRGPAADPAPVLYRPVAQTNRFAARTGFVAARLSPGATRADVVQTVRTVAPELPAFDVRSGSELVGPYRASQATLLVIMAVFGVTAVGLGLVGVYGVGMQTVRQRTREIGVRLALGATASRVSMELLGRGLASAGIGVAPGVLLALLIARLLDGFLFGVGGADVRVPLLASVAVLAVTAVALAVPGRLAAATDPATATRDG